MAVATAEILDAISNMTVLELSQLIKDMEDKFGVSAAAATVAMAAPAAGGAAAAAEEKTEFTVNLTASGANKLTNRERRDPSTTQLASNPLRPCRDPLVGRRESHPHVPGAARAVEVARCHQDPARGEPRHRLRARLVPGDPEVEASL